MTRARVARAFEMRAEISRLLGRGSLYIYCVHCILRWKECTGFR
jgi:hypothetical protein